VKGELKKTESKSRGQKMRGQRGQKLTALSNPVVLIFEEVRRGEKGGRNYVS